MESSQFEDFDSSDPRKLEDLSFVYAMRKFPNEVKGTATDEEIEELDHFLRTANEEDIQEVKKRAIFTKVFYNYINPDISPEKKDKIETEMERDPELKEHVKSSQMKSLINEYLNWRYYVDRGEIKKEYEMKSEDIFTFFNSLDEYNEIVEEAFAESNNDEIDLLRERGKLQDLKDYFNNKMSSKEKSDFHDEILENQALRSMFVKIQDALR